MWTINDLIKSGMEFFTAKTVPKADLDTATAARDSEKSRADKAASDLAAMTKERDELKAALAAKNAELESAKAEVAKLTGAKGDADAAAVAAAAAKKAAALAAAAGQPTIPGEKGPGATQPPGTLIEQRAALKDPQELAAFDAKHGKELMALAREELRKSRRK